MFYNKELCMSNFYEEESESLNTNFPSPLDGYDDFEDEVIEAFDDFED